MFQNLPKHEQKTDLQLSTYDGVLKNRVASFLPGCSSSSSSHLDSQYKVGASRLKGSLGARACVASMLPPGSAGRHDDGGEVSVSSSGSSFHTGSKHSAFVELCCGPKSLLGSEAARRNLKTLRVTKESHDLTTPGGRKPVRSDVLSLAKVENVHLWASLPCRPWSQLAELNRRKLAWT